MDDHDYDELWRYLEFADEPLFLEAGVRGVPWDERKPAGGLVQRLFDLRRFIPEGKPVLEPEDEAQSYLIGRLKETRSTIAQFEEEALARGEVHDQALEEIDYQISRAALSLDRFSGWSVGYNTGVDILRNQLQRELSNLRKERRSALVRTWEDVSALRKEFREAVAEYRSLLERLRLL